MYTEFDVQTAAEMMAAGKEKSAGELAKRRAQASAHQMIDEAAALLGMRVYADNTSALQEITRRAKAAADQMDAATALAIAELGF